MVYTKGMKRYGELALIVLVFLAFTVGAFFLADSIAENDNVREFVRGLGVFGVILTGLASGLNAFVPIPPATFAPLFLEADIPRLVVISGFVIGTTIADSIGFFLGRLGRGYASTHHPAITNKLQAWMEGHMNLIPFIIFVFFLLAPLPNETILIPLAVIGYQYRRLIVPLILGNIGHHALMVYGYETVFGWWF